MSLCGGLWLSLPSRPGAESPEEPGPVAGLSPSAVAVPTPPHPRYLAEEPGGSRRSRGGRRRLQPRGHGCGAGAARRERARGCGSLSWCAGKAQPGSGERHPRPGTGAQGTPTPATARGRVTVSPSTPAPREGNHHTRPLEISHC